LHNPAHRFALGADLPQSIALSFGAAFGAVHRADVFLLDASPQESGRREHGDRSMVPVPPEGIADGTKHQRYQDNGQKHDPATGHRPSLPPMAAMTAGGAISDTCIAC
jgi:hypothetical protein